MCFNPRTHEGCDVLFLVSAVTNSSFNPRTHEGCDEVINKVIVHELWFQSTHPQGVRQDEELRIIRPRIVSIHAPTRGATKTLVSLIWALRSFNPRTHEGCDTFHCVTSQVCLCFNPRTHEGCDRINLRPILHGKSFNPRTHEGCDLLS